MKKSKVLIPAMALLLFSTAASITGTVAWFSSTRVFQTTVGDFTVQQLDGNLDVEMGAGAGTTAATDKKSVSVNANVQLVDASVNFSKEAYRLDPEAASPNIYKKITDTNYIVQTFGTTGHEVYYHAAVSWTMKIKYKFASEGGNMGVYLDLQNSAFTKDQTDKAGTNGGDSGLGFRIMFHDGSAETSTVWGKHKAELGSSYLSTYPMYDEDEDSYTAETSHVIYEGVSYECTENITEASQGDGVGDFDPAKWKPDFKSTLDENNGAETPVASPINLKYVNSTSATVDYKKSVETGESTQKGNYFTLDSNIGRYSDGAGNTLKANRIATILKSDATEANSYTVEKTVTCLAWFEGTDPNVINDTAMKTIGAKMVIYARCDAGTAA